MPRITKNYCCIKCGGLINIHTALYGKGICLNCFKHRKISLNYCCKDCGSLIHQDTALKGKGRCTICSHIGELSSNYIDGHTLKNYYCIDCGKPLVGYQAIRCRKCHHKQPISIEKKQKISLNHADVNGKNNPNWKGGLSSQIYPITFCNELKELIRIRDHHTCQNCGASQKNHRRKLDVHHINYKKNDIYPKNLISLCDSCHSKTNTNRKEWITKFLKIINTKRSYNFDLLLHEIKNISVGLKTLQKELPEAKFQVILQFIVDEFDKLYEDAKEVVKTN